MKKYIIILILLCELVYANSLKGVYLSDDIDAIQINPDLSFKSNWQYPTYFTDKPLEFLNKINPRKSAYNCHISAVIWHSANTILVLFFLMLFFSPRASFWGTVIFAVHPIHTEAVMWVTGRRYLTMFFFTMLPYLLYHYATIKRFNLKYYLLALLMFTYNFTSPLNFYVLFPLYLILDDWYFKKVNWKLWLPFGAVLIYGVIIKHYSMVLRIAEIQNYTNFISIKQPLSLFIPDTLLETNWANAWLYISVCFFRNLRLIFFPFKLTFYHEPIIVEPQLMLELIALFIPICLMFLSFASARKIVFILIFYFITLLPTYSPIFIVHMIAERYLYLSSIIICFFIALWTDKFKNKTYTILLVCLIIFYSGRTIWRNTDYYSAKKFWQVTTDASPLNPLGYNNLGVAYANEGNYDEAIRKYCRAFKLNPNDDLIIENMTKTFYKKGFVLQEVQYNYQTDKFKISVKKIGEEKVDELPYPDTE